MLIKSIRPLFKGWQTKKSENKRDWLHEKQLMEVNKFASLGILVSGIIHEINNPNNFITLNTPVLKEIFNSIDPFVREKMSQPGNEKMQIIFNLSIIYNIAEDKLIIMKNKKIEIKRSIFEKYTS